MGRVMQINETILTREKPKLLDQVRAAIRTKHYSLKTEKAYLHWIRRFILYHNKRHPAEMGEKEIGEFLTHLAVKENVAASTQNQALCAILFLYNQVLGKELGDFPDIAWAKKPKSLPVVFTREEAKAVLQQLSGTNWIMGMLLYGAGLRLSECLQLRVSDCKSRFSSYCRKNKMMSENFDHNYEI
jgi:site-specific recombinase XerD